jgi:hypothetical protein
LKPYQVNTYIGAIIYTKGAKNLVSIHTQVESSSSEWVIASSSTWVAYSIEIAMGGGGRARFLKLVYQTLSKRLNPITPQQEIARMKNLVLMSSNAHLLKASKERFPWNHYIIFNMVLQVAWPWKANSKYYIGNDFT